MIFGLAPLTPPKRCAGSKYHWVVVFVEKPLPGSQRPGHVSPFCSQRAPRIGNTPIALGAGSQVLEERDREKDPAAERLAVGAESRLRISSPVARVAGRGIASPNPIYVKPVSIARLKPAVGGRVVKVIIIGRKDPAVMEIDQRISVVSLESKRMAAIPARHIVPQIGHRVADLQSPLMRPGRATVIRVRGNRLVRARRRKRVG